MRPTNIINCFGIHAICKSLVSIMQKYGRRADFTNTWWGLRWHYRLHRIYLSDFSIFLIGSFLSGIYNVRSRFYRLPLRILHPKASNQKQFHMLWLAYDSAIIGPQLVKLTSRSNNTLFGNIFNCNLLNLIGAFLFLYLKIPPLRPEQNKIL